MQVKPAWGYELWVSGAGKDSPGAPSAAVGSRLALVQTKHDVPQGAYAQQLEVVHG